MNGWKTTAGALCAACGAAGYALWMRRECLTDSLTGLGNRRSFQRDLHRLFRQTGPLALCLLDVDDFKTINDSRGHPGGDEVLVELSRRLRRAAGEQGRFSRYGGDEFAVFLTGADAVPAGCRDFGRRLSRELARPWSAGGRPVAVTVCAGISAAAAGESPERLVLRADRALYQAKKLGPGRIVFLKP